MRFRFFYISLLLFFVLGSCKKEDERTTPPEITFILPVQNTVYNVFDTVLVKFDVSDNEHLSNVTVSLLDASNLTAMPGIVVTPSSNSATITMNYELNDIHLASGYYFIKVYANDGQAGVYALQRIYINEEPKALKYPLFVTAPVLNTRSLFKIDSLQNIQSIGTYSGDFSEAATSSWYQDHYLGGYFNGPAIAIGLEDNSQLWTIAPVISSTPYFTDLQVSGKNVYISYYDGRIRGFNVNGSAMYNALVAPNWYPRKIALHDSYMVASIKEISTVNRKIVLFNSTSGAGVQETYMNQDVIEFFTKDANDLFCFGNDAGQGKIEIYQVNTNGFWTPYPGFPAGTILSVAQVDAGTYLIGHSNGTVYKYVYSINSLTTHMAGVTAAHIAYDDVNQVIYVAEGMNVKRFNYVSGALINTIPHTSAILDLDLLFNK